MRISRLILPVLVASAGAAFGQLGMPEVVITPVAHEGDPAPGIPGATLDLIVTPRIDADGNVLFTAFLAGPDIDESNYMAVFYGPPGGLEKIAQMGDPAPDMGGEILIGTLLQSSEWLSENGWISFTPRLLGPGMIPGVNDKATFVGPPGDIRKVLQGGDQAQGLDPGVVIDVSGSGGFGTMLSDNATLLVVGDIAGPGVDSTNERV